MAAIKKSAQRDAILAELMNRYDHPTAEALYLDLKKTMPALSLATVYRNLKVLEKEGKILRITGKDAEHFDGNPKNHYHLTCRCCQKIIDLDVCEADVSDIMPKDFLGKIESHTLMYFGLCPKCSKANKA